MVGQEERGGDAFGCFIIYRNQLRRHLPFWCVFWCACAHTHTHTGNDQWSDGAENRMDKWGGRRKKINLYSLLLSRVSCPDVRPSSCHLDMMWECADSVGGDNVHRLQVI